MTATLRGVLASTACVAALAAVAGLLFVPVFGLPALVLPVGVPALALVVAAALCRRPALAPWRPPATLASGLLAIAETTLWPTTATGLPTADTVAAFEQGITSSWQQVLQSTWPARAEAELLLFVPLLVVIAGVLGIELVHRVRAPVVAVLPSLFLLISAQAYVAASGWSAVGVGLAYVALVGSLLALHRDRAGGGGGRLAAVGVGLVGVVALLVATVAIPAPIARYSLRDDRTVPLVDLAVASPLDRIASRLADPDTPVFRLHGDVSGYWPLVVLEKFDGVTWHPGTRYRRFGAGLRPGPEVEVPVHRRTTRVEVLNLERPWLPSRTWPSRVEGAAPLVEEQHGSLLVPDGPQPREYTLAWWDPEIAPRALADAPVDAAAEGGLAPIGTVPPKVAALAERAAGEGRPTFRAAVRLERYLREHYTVVPVSESASGHSWPHLERFLLSERRGTSEQFAAAYVALARARGIPARLVVGFAVPANADSYTVRNGDVEAWPEVAVEGVGWVALDPTGVVSAAGGGQGDGLDAATDRARGVLEDRGPVRDEPDDEDDEEGPPTREADPPSGLPIWLVVLLPTGSAVSWFGGLTMAKLARRVRRRRRTGTAGVLAAWAETRDRLRAHGVEVTSAMTPREVAVAAAAVLDPPTVAALRALAAQVDLAAWSGPEARHTADRDTAWATVDTVRRGLARRGRRARLRAALDHRSLRAP